MDPNTPVSADAVTVIDRIRRFYEAVRPNHAYSLFYYTPIAIPLDVEEELSPAMRLFVRVSGSDRDAIRAAVTDRIGSKLAVYAARMASLGVRRGSEQVLLDGVTALAIDDDVVDWRDILVSLSLLCNACRRLGLEYGAFLTIADSAIPERRKLLREYITEEADERTLGSMGFEAVNTSEGFLYRPVPWGSTKA